MLGPPGETREPDDLDDATNVTAGFSADGESPPRVERPPSMGLTQQSVAHSTQKAVAGSASNRAGEIGRPQASQIP